MRADSLDPANQDADSDHIKVAPVQSDPVVELAECFNKILGKHFLQLLADAIPEPAAIISSDWQIISANRAISDFKTSDSSDKYVNGRPGDILACIHAIETPGGCGNTDYCKFCGIYNAIVECQRTGKQISKECRLSSRCEGETFSHDFLITITPYQYNDKIFYVFTAKDISDKKRRIILEKMLFNSVYNTVSELNDILHEIKGTKVNLGIKESGEFAEKAANNLLNKILFLRTLDAAEKGDLRPAIIGYDVNLIMQEVAAFLRHHKSAEGKSIVVEPFKGTSEPFTDVELLRWALINLVKNGLEASFRNDTVTMSALESAGNIYFNISNQGIIPEGVRHQIFQRSFSTKGSDRGLGSYSVKLFITKYLLGKVFFESDEQQGTIFTITIPIEPIIKN
ncbi:MAG: HAMP domain-containing histidine kinase [Lentimicrobium sp.]|nr:HAMP domain-containing histidine kinase [Lentimicrobium sp.]